MNLQGPAARYKVQTNIIQNVNRQFRDNLTFGQFIADKVANVVGSWPFIIYQSIAIVVWVCTNSYLAYMASSDPSFFASWDPYPFILLNLALSFQAAYTGPVVMMSQNRQAEKDRLMAEQDYLINRKAEEEIQVIMAHLVHQDTIIAELINRIERITKNTSEISSQDKSKQ
ncbi:DUF1003 domain-containing protein [Dendrosporobacter sp. 1207_IL3150]|uniref:DUF1003 domain-containing protein n=1 Tax=Dendrosporobacter sp. 1207_IL3150 TaxID=3084054 RepID=UPI002FD8D4A3